MRKQDIKSAGDHHALRSLEVMRAVRQGFVVDTGKVHYGPAEAQTLGAAAQEANTELVALRQCEILDAGVAFVVPHAAEDAGFGAQAGDLTEACVERVPVRGNKIAGNDGE